ncbi:MAG TPA: low molecular weight phosphotyrosine protein phosphatase, partial [Reyranella sp.]|nr:low molecular weight phosphotyrosine protein phosphatase [Reyranella sp.]
MTIGVLFVCTANICRSPMAEGVFRALAQRAGLGDAFRIASAGTTGIHAGEAPT